MASLWSSVALHGVAVNHLCASCGAGESILLRGTGTRSQPDPHNLLLQDLLGSGSVLWHVDPLLGNGSEMSNNAATVTN
jgi:hypothetical protein